MFQYIKKLICYIFGHNWQTHVLSTPHGRGATTINMCKRCGKINK